MKITTIAVLLIGLTSVVTFASDLSPVQSTEMHLELKKSMQTMHDGMQKGMISNDPDIAFAAGMLPHHVGAVEMAKIELKYGTDPEMRQLAKNIIASQDKEIKQMQSWLKDHGQLNK